jgi:hypothetical protein
MSAWLHHSAIQGIVLPLVAALVVAEALQRLRLSGLAILAGVAVAAYLSFGTELTPATPAERALLATFAAGGLGIVLEFAQGSRLARFIPPIAAGAAALWVLWGPLLSAGTLGMAMHGFVAVALCAWIAAITDSLEALPSRAAASALGLGAGLAAAAWFAHASLTAHLAAALGAAGAAHLLIQFLSAQALPAGRVLTLPTAMLAGLLGAAAWMLDHMPWPTLVPLALLPLALRLPVAERAPVRIQVMVHSAIALALAAAAAMVVRHPIPGLPT